MSERKGYIDVLKGIGIFFVVFGHVTHTGVLRQYIWNFHMPLFFLISGLLFNTAKYPEFKGFFKSRVKSIYLPYVFFFVVTFLYWVFIERKFRGDYSVMHQLLGLPYGTYEGHHLNFNGALWFLPCLFSVEIMFYYVSKLTNKVTIFAILLGSFVIGALLYKYNLNVLPLGIHTAFVAIVFYGIGFLSKPLEVSFKNGSLFSKLLFLIACFALQIYAIKEGYSTSIGKPTLVYIPVAIIGILFYYNLSLIIGSNRILEYLGKNSLVILAFQEQVYRAVIFVTSKVMKLEVEVVRHNIYISLGIAVISILIIVPAIFIYNKYIRLRLNSLIK